MTELQLVLLVLAVAAAVTQLALVAMGVAMMSRENVTNVKIGPWAGIASIVLFIAIILL